MDLSFIIPVYNLEDYIGATLDSILQNEFDFEYEILVVNDGSLDNSRKIVEEYAEKFKRVILFNNENHGVSYARNFGIEKARGRYITFVDGDDLIEANVYVEMMRKIKEGSYDFVQCSFATVRDQNTLYMQFSKTEELCDKERMFELFFAPDKRIYNSCWGKIINKEGISNIRFNEELVVAEDQRFLFDILYNAEKILLIKEVGYRYFERSNSAMRSMNAVKCQNKIAALQDCLERCPYPRVHDLIRYQQGLAWIEYYNLAIKYKDKNAKNIRKELKSLLNREVKELFGKKDKLKILLLTKCNFIYKLLVKAFY